MQRTGLNRRRVIITNIIAILLIVLLLFIDQLSKIIVRVTDLDATVIKNFFYLTHVENTGAAWGFLAGKSWSQLFFKLLTGVSLIIFIGIFVYACIKDYRFLRFATVMIIAGTLGNFIDRLLFSSVTDFLELVLFNVSPFGVFNFADVFLCVGIFATIIHFLFIDENAIFKSNGNKENNSRKR